MKLKKALLTFLRCEEHAGKLFPVCCYASHAWAMQILCPVKFDRGAPFCIIKLFFFTIDLFLSYSAE